MKIRHGSIVSRVCWIPGDREEMITYQNESSK